MIEFVHAYMRVEMVNCNNITIIYQPFNSAIFVYMVRDDNLYIFKILEYVLGYLVRIIYSFADTVNQVFNVPAPIMSTVWNECKTSTTQMFKHLRKSNYSFMSFSIYSQ